MDDRHDIAHSMGATVGEHRARLVGRARASPRSNREEGQSASNDQRGAESFHGSDSLGVRYATWSVPGPLNAGGELQAAVEAFLTRIVCPSAPSARASPVQASVKPNLPAQISVTRSPRRTIGDGFEAPRRARIAPVVQTAIVSCRPTASVGDLERTGREPARSSREPPEAPCRTPPGSFRLASARLATSDRNFFDDLAEVKR